MTTAVTADFSGAVRKTQTLLNLARAHKAQGTVWASETVKELKRSAADRQISGQVHHGKKTSQMGRGVGFSIDAGESLWSVLIGTGVGGREKVRYALIQDIGGTTHPRVTKRMRGWAWAMYRRWGEERYKWIALTKKQNLTIKIHPSGWFTSVIEKRSPVLRQMMAADTVYRLAEAMGSSSTGGLAKHTK